MRFQIQINETGDVLDTADTFEEAYKIVQDMYLEEVQKNEYVPRYYDIYDTETEECKNIL